MEVTLAEMLMRLGQKDIELFKLQEAYAKLVERTKDARAGPSETDLAHMTTPGQQVAPA